jgi:uncharacterized membrane protein YeaQ/YmgE (transglycosylase-associated protein family)
LAGKEETMHSTTTFLKYAIAGLIVSVIGVAIVWLLADAISPDLYAKPPGQDMARLTFGTAIFVTLVDGAVGALIGWLLFWRDKPRSWWYVIVAIVLVLEAINAFHGTTTTETALWLNAMHLAAGLPLAYAVGQTLRRG